MQTLEKNSPDWISIGEAFQKTLRSIRDIAREHGLSDTAVRKKAKALNWSRPDLESECEPSREPESEPGLRPEFAAKAVADASVSELTKRGRAIILDLMAELEFLNKNALVLSEIVEAWFNGDKETGVRNKLLKALDYETRAKTSNYLATALAKLNDAAPGKKKERQENAEKSASSGLFAAPSPPKMTMQ